MTISELIVKIVADASGVKTGVDEASKELSKLGDSTKATDGKASNLLGSLGQLKDILAKSALVGAAMAATKAMYDLSKEFAEAETAAKRLEVVSNLNGVSEGSDRINALAGELQKLTGASADYTVQLGAQLISQGKSVEQTEAILKTAADLSSVTGQDLASAVQQLSTTYSGMAGQLGKLNPELKDLTAEELKQGKAVEILGAKYAGIAQEMQGTTGVAFARFAENLGDTKENLGALFAPLLRNLANFGSKIMEVVNAAAPAFKVLGEILAGVVAVFQMLVAGVAGLVVGFDGLAAQLKKVGDLFDVNKQKQKAAEQATRDQQRAIADYKKELDGLTDAELQLRKVQLESAEKALRAKGFTAQADLMKKAIDEVKSEIIGRDRQLAASAKAAAQKELDERRRATDETIELLKRELTQRRAVEDQKAVYYKTEANYEDIRKDLMNQYFDLITNPDITEAQKKQLELIRSQVEALPKLVESAKSYSSAMQTAFEFDLPDYAAEAEAVAKAQEEAAERTRQAWLTALSSLQTVGTSIFSGLSDVVKGMSSSTDTEVQSLEERLAQLQQLENDYMDGRISHEEYLAQLQQLTIDGMDAEAIKARLQQIENEKALETTRLKALETGKAFLDVGVNIGKFFASGMTDLQSLISGATGLMTIALDNMDAETKSRVENMLNSFSEIMTDLLVGLSPLFKFLVEMLVNVFDVLKPIFEIFNTLSPILKPLFDVLGFMAKLTLAPLVAALNLVADLLQFIMDLLKPITDTLSNVGSGLQSAGQAIGSALGITPTGDKLTPQQWVDSQYKFLRDGGMPKEMARLAILQGLAGMRVDPSSVTIPTYASGTDFAQGGLSLVGERGPELVNLPRGSQVIPNHSIGSADGRGVTINIYSPVAVTPSEAANIFRSTARELAFTGVL